MGNFFILSFLSGSLFFSPILQKFNTIRNTSKQNANEKQQLTIYKRCVERLSSAKIPALDVWRRDVVAGNLRGGWSGGHPREGGVGVGQKVGLMQASVLVLRVREVSQSMELERGKQVFLWRVEVEEVGQRWKGERLAWLRTLQGRRWGAGGHSLADVLGTCGHRGVRKGGAEGR